MLLSDTDIISYGTVEPKFINIEKLVGDKYVDGFDELVINSNSVDLTLHENIYAISSSNQEPLDFKKGINKDFIEKVVIPESGYVLDPKVLYLGVTKEFTSTDVFAMSVEGRSTCGRYGLSIHQTAGFGDVGFKGHWTLELSCVVPVKIYPNMRIAQVYFTTLSKVAKNLYGSDNESYSQNKFTNELELWPVLPRPNNI